MAKGDEAAELRRIFVTNLRRLMDARGFTARETARKAGIEDFKRFHRWVSTGITRATREHDADLEKLRELFGLSGLQQFWPKQDSEGSSSKTSDDFSLAERIFLAGSYEWEYVYAYKLLVVLRQQGRDESRKVWMGIDGMFNEAIEAKLAHGDTPAKIAETPAEILEPKTPKQIVSFLKINYPQKLETLLKQFGSEETIYRWLEDDIQRRGHSKKLLKRVLNTVKEIIEAGDK